MWPGVWPGAASVTMPGATSAPGSKRVTLSRDVGKYPPLVAEGEFQIRRRGVQVGVVHPELPFRRRHHDLGIGEDQLVVLVLDAVDVVGVEMRDDDEVDRFRIDAGGDKIGAQHAGRGRDLAAGTGIDQHELLAGIDDQRRKRRRQLVGRHEGVGERALDFGERRVADEFVGDRAIPDAVIERGQFEGPDPVAINAGRLLPAGGAAAAAERARAESAADAEPARSVRRVTIGTVLSRPAALARGHLQCFSWHCWLHAAGFFIEKFLAHQLLQDATQCGEAAAAFVPVTGASIATIITAIAIRGSALFMVPSISAVGATRR